MAGDVATTGGAEAGATHALPGQPDAAGEDTVASPPADAGPAELDTDQESAVDETATAPGSRSLNGRSASTSRSAGAGRGAGSGRAARRLARLGATRGGGINPVLEPMIKTLRATHPKADVRLIEHAYDVAAHWHTGQKRKSGDPYITHPLAVATILAELGMNSETLCAALLHDTVEDTDYALDTLRADFGDEIAALVDGVTKLDKVKYGEVAEAETGRDGPSRVPSQA